jgi:hypothetical protein
LLIPLDHLQRIAEGRVTLAFRRWKKPTVKPGGTLRTAVGVLAIDAVDAIDESEISAQDARAAGHDNLDLLLAALSKSRGGSLFRIRLRLLCPDPRAELRGRGSLSDDEARQLLAALSALDRRSHVGPWTHRTLACIAEQPQCRAADLAVLLGFDKAWLKANIRKLKELGLTESLPTGYRISRRGQASLEHMLEGVGTDGSR